MRKPTLTHETIFTVLMLSGVASCSRGERAAPEPAQPASQVAPPADVKPASPPPPAPTAPKPVADEVAGKDAGAGAARKGGVGASCGAGSCSADMRKKGNK